MNSIAEGSEKFSFGDLIYWGSISFSISFVASLNYFWMFLFEMTRQDNLYIDVGRLYVGILIVSLGIRMVDKSIVGKFIIFVLIASPVSLLLKFVLDVNYLEYAFSFLALFPLVLLLIGILYKRIFYSINLMFIVFFLSSLVVFSLFPNTYKLVGVYFFINIYLIMTLNLFYLRGVREKNKNAESAFSNIMKTMFWPIYKFKS